MAFEAMYGALEQAETSSKESEFDARWTELLDRITENPEKEYEGLTEKTRFKLVVSSQGNVTATTVMNPQVGSFSCSRFNLKKVFLAYADNKEVTTREVNETLGVGNHAGLAAVLFRELQSIEFSKGQKSGTGRAASSYEERKQIVLEYLEQLETSGYKLKPKDQRPRFVLVVDEVNRGNISKILGELVTLLEPDKRIGAEHQLRPVLPYSAERFGVPQNLFVIGTMNTADKSIALVDVALRRRFQFEELMPDLDYCELLPSEMRQVINKLNARIVLRKDRDHQIGHSYFMDVSSPDQFNEKFTVTIIPLLKEYFYNDWDGLRFVFAEEKKEDGYFIRRIGGADTKWARNIWQWYTDAGDKAFDCLRQLLKNYGIDAEAAEDET
jgi:5-methylcytosine-specific restriction protein B